MISTSVPTVPVVPHIPFIPFVLKIPAVLSVSFVSDVSRELICTGSTSCTLGTDDTLDTDGTSPSLSMSFLTLAAVPWDNPVSFSILDNDVYTFGKCRFIKPCHSKMKDKT